MTPRKKRAKPAKRAPAKRAKAPSAAKVIGILDDRLEAARRELYALGLNVRKLEGAEKHRQKLAEELGRLARKVAEGDGWVTSLQGTIAGVYRDHRILEKNAGVFAQKINAATQRIEALEKAPGGVGELERRVESLEARLRHLALLSEKTDDDTGDLADRIAKLEAFRGEAEARRRAAVDIRRAAAARFDRLEGKVDAGIGSLSEGLDELERRVESLEAPFNRAIREASDSRPRPWSPPNAPGFPTDDDPRPGVPVDVIPGLWPARASSSFEFKNGAKVDGSEGPARPTALDRSRDEVDRLRLLLERRFNISSGLERKIAELEEQLDAATAGEGAADREVQRLQAENAELRARLEGSEKPGPSRGDEGADAAVSRVRSWANGDASGGLFVRDVGATLAELNRARIRAKSTQNEALEALGSLAGHYRIRSQALGPTAINERGAGETNDEASRERATAKAEAIEHAAAMLAKRWGR